MIKTEKNLLKDKKFNSLTIETSYIFPVIAIEKIDGKYAIGIGWLNIMYHFLIF